MKILVGQINPTIGDFKGNVAKIMAVTASARKKGAEIVLFPEMSLCGYPPEDLLLHAAFIHDVEKALEKVVEASEGLMVVVGLARKNLASSEKPLLNSAAIIQNKKLIGFHDKWLLPTYDVFDERRYFEPGSALTVWDFKGKKIAVTICEDIWQHSGYVDYSHYPRDPIIDLKALKPDFMLNLSASPYHFQKPELRLKVCSKCASSLHCPVVLACQVGGNDGLVFDGYSAFVDANGNVLELAAGFKEDEMLIDLDKMPSPQASHQAPHFDEYKDLHSALVLGIRDYFHKQGFKKATLGLSGGIDSALAVCLAVDALGKENVLAVSMPSRYSSPGSVKDAKQLAGNLGIKLETFPIEGPFESYLSLLEPFFKEKKWDVTEENIQARIRGMILMALSNKLGYIVISTGNKSEMALGFCTLYGDMAGGLGAIADLSKKQVYALSKWINKEKEIIPHSILEKAPSAELRAGQKDSDTIPEYPIIDAVLEGYVEDLLSAEEISKKYKIPQNIVDDLICKIHAAEYKRRQSPPAIRVSKKAFRAGRRYPIVQKWQPPSNTIL